MHFQKWIKIKKNRVSNLKEKIDRIRNKMSSVKRHMQSFNETENLIDGMLLLLLLKFIKIIRHILVLGFYSKKFDVMKLSNNHCNIFMSWDILCFILFI